MKTVYTDRSRIETYQRCNRARYLAYHQNQVGIQSAEQPLPLCVGASVHAGLAYLLGGGQNLINTHHPWVESEAWRIIEDAAVNTALADFSQYKSRLALDTTELAEQSQSVTVPDNQLREQLAGSLGMSVEDAGLDSLMQSASDGAKLFDEYLWQEQSSLVEALVRAYARRRLRPLLEEFEVLEVEREGEWELDWYAEAPSDHSLVFMSRPDALLRERSSGHLYLLSFKTASGWDVRKARDAEHDMQGLSEGIEVEKRTGERIMGVRYEYILKNYRKADKELSARVGFAAWTQRSHLLRAYKHIKSGERNWSYDFLKEDGSTSSLSWQNWKSRPVWEDMSIKAWIDLLDDSQRAMSAFDSTVGMEPRELGWKSVAQATGLTAEHPLDAVFIPPITVFRQDDDLRDLVEQMEAQERRVAEAVAQVEAAASEEERRSLLNIHFPQTRRACEYPTTCQFSKICYGSEDMRARPLDSGKYVARTPHHKAELEALTEKAKS